MTTGWKGLGYAAATACLVACGGDTSEKSEDAAAATAPPEVARARALLDSAIVLTGTDRLADAELAFRFRDGRYTYARTPDGLFRYTRTRIDSAGAEQSDALDNAGLTRTTDGTPVRLSAKRQAAYASSVNSVIYFAFLPWALADEAARPRYEGLDTLGGRPYHRLRVTFTEEGGGADYDDEFLYWLDVADLGLDYLAYSYAVDGGGVRFREAFNERAVDGLTVRDYRNYAAEPDGSVPLPEMAGAFAAGELKLVSVIELEDVEVLR